MIEALKMTWETLTSRKRETSIMVALLIVVACIEIVGLTLLLPILSIIFDAGEVHNKVVTAVLGFFDVQHTLGHLLLALVVVGVLKAGVSLLAKLVALKDLIAATINAFAKTCRKMNTALGAGSLVEGLDRAVVHPVFRLRG